MTFPGQDKPRISKYRKTEKLNCHWSTEQKEAGLRKGQFQLHSTYLATFIVSVKLTASMLIEYKLTYKDPGLTQ